MPPSPGLDGGGRVSVELPEWQRLGPEKDPRLRTISFADDPSAQRVAEQLRHWVKIRPGFRGLEIESTSYVGRVDVGAVRITIRPKLRALPLGILLRYAYGLRDIATFQQIEAPVEKNGFQDLLIAMLLAETEELVHRGLARRYVPEAERLQSPRGRIMIERIARNGGIVEARLPCRHFDRRVNWHLNRTVRAGLELAGAIAGDGDLSRHVLRVAECFGEPDQTRLAVEDVARAEIELTRLTAAYAPALTIIRLLQAGQGLAFGTAIGERVPGFLFDMNRFFQRLLSRFLHNNLGDAVLDERRIENVFAYATDANPRDLTDPTLRPDFAFRDSGKRLAAFLDAKYRDIWDKGLPASWLYQLSIYALVAPHRTAVLLYATTSAGAGDEQIQVRPPVGWGSGRPASIVLRPVNLQRLADLVGSDAPWKMRDERRRFAEELVKLLPVPAMRNRP